MNGLGILAIIVIGVLVVIGFAVFLRAEDARDDRLLRHRNPFPEPAHPGFGDIPRFAEIAHEPPRPSIHELPALGDAVWHQYPVTSPARFHPPDPREGEGPGTAAAAGDGTPPASPPPLPDPAYAAANPTAYPLAWLESDTFVTGLQAIKDGAP